MKKVHALLLILLFVQFGLSQTTEISYQGSLQSGGGPANGNHDFEFVLFDSVAAGNQIGSVQSINNVIVTNGMFAVKLNFGNQFPGADRYLEIRVRPSGQPGITVLSPRQLLNSSPYSVKSLTAETATRLGGVAADQYVVTTDPRMSDARPPTAGSGDYVQNRTTQQGSTNFNVSGNGTAGGRLTASQIRATTAFEIGASRIMHATGSFNIFAGVNSGANVTTGSENATFGWGAGTGITAGGANSFFGTAAGGSTTVGSENSFFGRASGASNESGIRNSFFGSGAGAFNVAGDNNSFYGYRAGFDNLTDANSFFGHLAGFSTTTGPSNSFFGAEAGVANTTGRNNAFFGANAGSANTTAIGNSFFGANSGAANTLATGNSFFGVSTGLVSTGANNSFFGAVAGVANTTGFNNSFFGNWAGHENTTGDNNVFVGRLAGEISSTGNSNTFIGANAGDANVTGSNNTIIGSGADVTSNEPINFATAIGSGAIVTTSSTIMLGRSSGFDRVRVPGPLNLGILASGTTENLCTAFGGGVGICASSLRYKSDVSTYTAGVSVVRQLRPIAFTWKETGMADVGFAAEEVDEIEPRLVVRHEGKIEGVRYGQITTVLVNAVKEQQAEIEKQRSEIDELRSQIETLKKVICAASPGTAGCEEKREK